MRCPSLLRGLHASPVKSSPQPMRSKPVSLLSWKWPSTSVGKTPVSFLNFIKTFFSFFFFFNESEQSLFLSVVKSLLPDWQKIDSSSICVGKILRDSICSLPSVFSFAYDIGSLDIAVHSASALLKRSHEVSYIAHVDQDRAE